jgi:hypothetical protein
VELIHPNHVLKALKAFLEEYRGHRKYVKIIFFVNDHFIWIRATSQAAYQVATLDERDDSLDVEYWSKYPNVIDERRERLWDALLSGLQKYQ